MGAGACGNAAGAAAQRAARSHRGAGRRADEDGPRRRDRGAARRGGVRLRDRPAGRLGLRDDARLPSEHVSGGHRDAGSRAAEDLHRQARVRRQLLPVPRRRGARVHGAARVPHDGRDDRARRRARHAAGGLALEGGRSGSVADSARAGRSRKALRDARSSRRITASSGRSIASSSRPARRARGRRAGGDRRATSGTCTARSARCSATK